MRLKLNFFLKNYSIKRRIILSFSLLFIFFTLIIFLVFIFFTYNTITKEIENHLYSLAYSKSQNIEIYFKQSIERFELVTSRTVMRRRIKDYNQSKNQDDLIFISDVLKDAIAPIYDFERICILNLEGEVIASTDQKFLGMNIFKKDFFQKGKIKEDVYFVKEEEEYKIIISGPIRLEEELIAVGITVINLDYLKTIIYDRVGSGDTGEIVVAFYDEDGKRNYPLERLFEEEALFLEMESELTAEPMKKALLGISDIFINTLDYRNEKVLAVSNFIKPGNIRLVVKIDSKEAYSPLYVLFYYYLFILIFFIILYFFISNYISSLIVRPIKKMEEGVKKFELGKLDNSLNIKGKDEIALLSQVFDRMFATIKNSKAEIEKKVKEQTIEIKNSLDRFETLSKQSETYIWEVDSNAKYTYISDNVKDILGYSKEELLQKSVIDLHPKEAKEEFKKEVFKVLNNKRKLKGLENPIVAKNGKIIWVLSSGYPILGKKGNLLKFRGSDTNITKIKEFEKELKINKAKYETLVSNIPGIVYRCLFDKKWTMQYISKEIEELAGYPAVEFINNSIRSYESVIYYKDRSYVEKEIKKAVSNKKPWEIEYRILTKNKKIKWVLEKGRSVLEKEEKVKALDGIILDITKKKEIERDLVIANSNLEKFKLAVEKASDHIVITDSEGICLYANDMVEKITGFAKQEIIGKKAGTKENWGGLMDKKTYDYLWKIIKKDKKPFFGELKNKRKNGQEYNTQASIAPVLNKKNEVEFFVGIERDITREKEIDKAKTEFVSLASHQLRTPLSGINWYTEMLLNEDAGKINKEQKQYLEEIYRGNQRMVELVNALLNVSRIELGTFSIEPELVNVKKLAKEVIKDLNIKAREKKQKIKEKYEEKLPSLKADEKLLRIIIENLFSNAVKYTPPKGIIEISIFTAKKGNKIDSNKINQDSMVFIVKDNGYGISENQHHKVFQKLFRADNILSKDTEGTGLGLYIIKSILDHSGGKIWFQSKENKGTVFYIVIPLKGMRKKQGEKTLS